LSSSARLAPNALAVREALRLDTQGIAILPKSWLDSTIKQVDFKIEGSDMPSIPVLAYVNGTLNDSLKSWLACVQNSIK
jgi:hypothetical protein